MPLLHALLNLIPLSKGLALQMEWLLGGVTTCIKDNLIEEVRPLSAAKLASKFSKWELLTAAAPVALKQEAPPEDLIAISYQ